MATSPIIQPPRPLRKVDTCDVRDFSGDPSDAIYAANDQATAAGLPLYAPPHIYTLPTTLIVRWGLIGGGRLSQWSDHGQTELRPGTPGMKVVQLAGGGAQAILSNFCVEGLYTANVGLLFADNVNGGGRFYAENIRVMHCRKGVALSATQNATLFNMECYYNSHNWVLANGVRNCNFFACNGATYVGFGDTAPYYWATGIGIPADQTSNIWYHIDPKNTDYGYDGVNDLFVEILGNDRNAWFGGIFEGAQHGIKVSKDNYDGGSEPICSLNTYYSCEMSDNNAIFAPNNDSVGIIHWDDGLLGAAANDSYYTVQDNSNTPATKGFIKFTGAPMFLGGNQAPGRGFSIPSNYKDLIFIDSNAYRPGATTSDGEGQWASLRHATVVIDNATKIFTVTDTGYSGNANGLVLNPNTSEANEVPNDSLLTIQRNGLNAKIGVTILTMSGSGNVIVGVSQNGPPWMRTVGTITTPGSYFYDVHFNDTLDVLGIALVTGGAGTAFTAQTVTMKTM